MCNYMNHIFIYLFLAMHKFRNFKFLESMNQVEDQSILCTKMRLVNIVYLVAEYAQ